MTDDTEEKATVRFVLTTTTFSKFEWVDKRQKNGKWVPAFPETSLKKQEEYIAKWLARDRELGIL